MTRWVRAHPYTILAAFIFAALIVWCAYHPRPWWEYAGAVLYGVAYGMMTAPRREPEPWRPPGPSLPCPPGCHIRVAHRHDPIGSFR